MMYKTDQAHDSDISPDQHNESAGKIRSAAGQFAKARPAARYMLNAEGGGDAYNNHCRCKTYAETKHKADA